MKMINSTETESRIGGQVPNKLVKSPLTLFNKLTGKDGALTMHALTSFHKNSLERANSIVFASTDPSVDIRNILNTKRNEQVIYMSFIISQLPCKHILPFLCHVSIFYTNTIRMLEIRCKHFFFAVPIFKIFNMFSTNKQQ